MAALKRPITLEKAKHPFKLEKVLTLPSIGNNTEFTFEHVTMESEKYICIRQMAPRKSVLIVDMNMPNKPFMMLGFTVDSALMHPNSRIIAFIKARIQGTVQDLLGIFDVETKTQRKSYKMPEQVTCWKWISPEKLGLVTQTSVYHWSLEGDSEPIKMFERTANLANNKIISYQCDPTGKWLVLIGIAPGTPERPQLVKGNMQLFSVDQQCSQAFVAHAASFAQFKVPGNENPSVLFSFASKTLNDAGQVKSKLCVIELGAQPDG